MATGEDRMKRVVGETGDGDQWRPVKPVKVTSEDRWKRWKWPVKVTGETGESDGWRSVKTVKVTDEHRRKRWTWPVKPVTVTDDDQ